MSESIHPRIRFTKTREVLSPCRNNSTDAGIDFYVPTDLTVCEILSISSNNSIITELNPYKNFKENLDGFIEKITLDPGQRILIPSGIKVLIEPENSMLQANNKSGISSKSGLIFTAQVVDSPYIGEVHIGIFNSSKTKSAEIVAGKKLVQFIHIPVFLTKPQEISNAEYQTISEDWGTRGANGFGSGD